MKVPEFTYHLPATLSEACELGRELGAEACYIAGGTDLLVDLKDGRRTTGHVVALRSIPELKQISSEDNLLRIGAMTTLSEIAESEDTGRVFPVLREAVLHIGSIQIRNQGTIGGNFCGAVPCADAPPVCIAGEAQLRIVGVEGERTLPAEEFFIAPREPALEPGELLVEVLIPRQPGNSGASYQRFSLRKGTALAVASVAVRIVMDGGKIADARVVLGSVAPVPLPASECAGLLEGEPPSEELFRRAAKAAAAEAEPITDIRGSEQFRRDLVEVLTFRALHEAGERAGGITS